MKFKFDRIIFCLFLKIDISLYSSLLPFYFPRANKNKDAQSDPENIDSSVKIEAGENSVIEKEKDIASESEETKQEEVKLLDKVEPSGENTKNPENKKEDEILENKTIRIPNEENIETSTNFQIIESQSGESEKVVKKINMRISLDEIENSKIEKKSKDIELPKAESIEILKEEDNDQLADKKVTSEANNIETHKSKLLKTDSNTSQPDMGNLQI